MFTSCWTVGALLSHSLKFPNWPFYFYTTILTFKIHKFKTKIQYKLKVRYSYSKNVKIYDSNNYFTTYIHLLIFNEIKIGLQTKYKIKHKLRMLRHKSKYFKDSFETFERVVCFLHLQINHIPYLGFKLIS